jgi:serine/threonine-protein kinase RsbW
MSHPHAATRSFTIGNDLAEIGRLAEAVDDFCGEHALGGEVAQAFNLALDELLTNTIHYGYDDAGPHRITVALSVAGTRVTAVIEDDGRAFDPTQAGEPDIEAELDDRPIGGLGIHFVRAMMDGIGYERVEGVNRLTLTKHLGV